MSFNHLSALFQDLSNMFDDPSCGIDGWKQHIVGAINLRHYTPDRMFKFLHEVLYCADWVVHENVTFLLFLLEINAMYHPRYEEACGRVLQHHLLYGKDENLSVYTGKAKEGTQEYKDRYSTVTEWLKNRSEGKMPVIVYSPKTEYKRCTVKDVVVYLTLLAEQRGIENFKKTIDILESNGITGELLSQLTEQDMQSMGIDAFGHRKLLLTEARNVKKDDPYRRKAGAGESCCSVCTSGYIVKRYFACETHGLCTNCCSQRFAEFDTNHCRFCANNNNNNNDSRMAKRAAIDGGASFQDTDKCNSAKQVYAMLSRMKGPNWRELTYGYEWPFAIQREWSLYDFFVHWLDSTPTGSVRELTDNEKVTRIIEFLEIAGNQGLIDAIKTHWVPRSF